MQRLARGGKLELRLGVSRYNDGGVGETLEALAARAETWCTEQSWCSALIEGCGGWEKNTKAREHGFSSRMEGSDGWDGDVAAGWSEAGLREQTLRSAAGPARPSRS